MLSRFRNYCRRVGGFPCGRFSVLSVSEFSRSGLWSLGSCTVHCIYISRFLQRPGSHQKTRYVAVRLGHLLTFFADIYRWLFWLRSLFLKHTKIFQRLLAKLAAPIRMENRSFGGQFLSISFESTWPDFAMLQEEWRTYLHEIGIEVVTRQFRSVIAQLARFNQRLGSQCAPFISPCTSNQQKTMKLEQQRK